MTVEKRRLTVTVTERYALIGLLPTSGNFVTLTIVKNTRAALELTLEEAVTAGYKRTPEGAWAPVDIAVAEAYSADIEIPRVAFDMAAQRLQELEQSEQLGIEHMRLYELMVNDERARQLVDAGVVPIA